MLIQPERATDILFAVEKNTGDQQYLIREVVGPVEEFLGCAPYDLMDGVVQQVFPPEQARYFVENATFDDEADPIEQILANMPEPAVRHKDGRNVPVELMMQLERMHRGQELYALRIRPKALREHRTRERIMANEGVVKPHAPAMMDRVLQVPDAASCVHDLRNVWECLQLHSDAHACVAVLELRHFTRIRWRHGKDYAQSLLRTVAHAARNNLRREDMVARTGKAQLTMLLLDTDAIAADTVLTRLGLFLQQCRLELPDGGHVFAEIELGYQEIESEKPMNYWEKVAKASLAPSLSKNRLLPITLPNR